MERADCRFQPEQRLGSRFLLHLRHLANSPMMSALTVRGRWKDETTRERIDQSLYVFVRGPQINAESKPGVAISDYPTFRLPHPR